MDFYQIPIVVGRDLDSGVVEVWWFQYLQRINKGYHELPQVTTIYQELPSKIFQELTRVTKS